MRAWPALVGSVWVLGLVDGCGSRSPLPPGAVADDGPELPRGGVSATGGTSMVPRAGAPSGGRPIGPAGGAPSEPSAGAPEQPDGGTAGSFDGGAAGGAGAPAECPREPCLKVTQLAAGDDHTCALFTDGRVKCWGHNDHGQLGYGHTKNIGDDESPSSVGFVSVTASADVTVKRLAASYEHTCALLSDGSVVCWGLNDLGQLGYGNRHDVGDDELPSAVGPVSVTLTPGVTVAELAVGGSHTCVLLTDDSVKCWGGGGIGRLGYGNGESIGDDELPSAVAAVSVTTAPQVTTRQLTTSRFGTYALLSDDTLKTWGLNSFGELGYGNIETVGDDEVPSAVGTVSVSTKAGVTAQSVCGGDYHTCALLSDATVRCWGSTLDGEVGSGNKQRVGDDELPSSLVPVSITATKGVTVKQLACGFDHNCVILSDASVKCWGANVFGELGYGNLAAIGDDELPSSVGPVSVTTTPGVSVKAFALGYLHSCALLSDDSVKCWGSNKFGQLGYANIKTIGDDELPSAVGAVQLL